MIEPVRWQFGDLRQRIYQLLVVILVATGLVLTITSANAQESFDHFSTGFVLDGAHANVACEGCHANATFGATQSNCVACHSQSGLVRASSKPADHVLTSGQCSDCHMSASWTAVPFVDHTQVMGFCENCHDGVTATGKHIAHINSGNNCDDCHSTVAWTPANFDHINIIGNCASCHNGTDATGKHPTHAQTTNVCEDCHSTNFWSPALQVDHTQVLGSCASCHNGLTATGPGPNHFITQLQCDDCHSTVAWTPADYIHTGLAYEPQDHRGTQLCTDCHLSNTEQIPWQYPAFQPDCAGCHAGDYQQNKHEAAGGGFETVNQNRDCSGACHQKSSFHLISDSNWDR